MLDSYQDLIDELLQAPAAVRALLAIAADEPGQPEATRLVAALRDRDRLVLSRLQRMTRETSAHLSALPPFDSTLASEPAGDDPAALLDEFETARGDLVSLLMNLTLKDWERTATHDNGGIVTLSEEVEDHVDIDEAVRATLAAPRG